MNKKGFTLIELLAVIVILAIIALIATPIVLSIIEETKESAVLRSAEMYTKSAELSIEQSTLKNKNITDGTYNLKDGDICLNTDCTDKLEVEISGKVPDSGTITILNGSISELSLILDGKEIYKNDKGELVYVKKLNDICKPAKEQFFATNPLESGYKYECEVKPGTSYNFYVLKTPAEGDTTINLIMDQNINSDGTPAGMTGTTKNGENVYNLVAWISDSTHGCGSDGDYCATNEKGPITAMQFLYNATKDWTNIDPVNYTYNDRTVQGNADGEGYTSFISTNGVATITPVTGDGVTIGSKATPLRARMPIYASDTTITEVTTKTNASYLYDNLTPDGMNAPYGYWTLSSYADNSNYAWRVNYLGSVSSHTRVDVGGNFGVRPVITLKI